MDDQRTATIEDGRPRGLVAPSRLYASVWSFVYGFFSNGTPYDAPNRSETCPPV